LVFLRRFASDRESERRLRAVRIALRPLRITGVRNPVESRRLINLPLWLLFPFLFAIGDNYAINAMVHNTYVLGDWKRSIARLLALVVDCTSVAYPQSAGTTAAAP